MTSQLGQQTITIHVLPNISRTKDSQKMKFGQVLEYKKGNISLQKLCQNEPERLVPDLLMFLKKALKVVKCKWPAA